MQIGGFLQTSFIDFPEKISAVIFTKGCNFKCPYCHNPELINNAQTYDTDDILSLLYKKKNILQGVVISGGEPTLHDDLEDFCQEIKKMNYHVKLDTNGSNPKKIKKLIDSDLVDYMAMDIKANPKKYPEEISNKYNDNIFESLDIIRKSNKKHEFRIPCVYPFIDEDALSQILKFTQDSKVYLQKVNIGSVLDKQYFNKNGRALSENEINDLYSSVKTKSKFCYVR